MSFTITYSDPATPYYGGSIVAIPNPPTNVALDGIRYPIDLKEYDAGGLPSLRDGVVASSEPSDNLFDPTAGWWRYGFSWHHGAGQRVRDLGDDTDAARYYESVGINPWTRFQACLLNDVEQVLAISAATPKIAVTATHIYVTDGTALKRSADMSTWDTMSGTSGTIVDITSDGVNAYACTTTAIYECVVGSTTVNDITPTGVTNQFDHIHYVNNFLLVSDGDLLRDASGAALDTIKDHFQDGFRWTVAFTVGSRIYVGGYAGNRSQIFTLVTDSSGVISLSSEAADFFAGELLNDAISYGGSVILATSKGVRFATLSQDGTLTYGPVIDAPGNVVSVFADAGFAWFSWTNHPSGKAGIGRLSLTEFVDTLQPAYATDIYGDSSASGAVTAVARFSNKTVYAVASDGLMAEDTTTKLTTGYIEIGELYYGTVEDKSLMTFQVRTEELAANEAVTVQLYNGETGELVEFGSSSIVGSNGVVVDAEGATVLRMTGRITLTGDGSSTPCIRQWRGRAYPIVPAGDVWIVPLIIHSSVIVGEGQGEILSMDPWTEVERLKSKRRSRQIVTYQEGNHAFRVRIENYKVEPKKWTDDGDWLEVTMKLTLISV